MLRGTLTTAEWQHRQIDAFSAIRLPEKERTTWCPPEFLIIVAGPPPAADARQRSKLAFSQPRLSITPAFQFLILSDLPFAQTSSTATATRGPNSETQRRGGSGRAGSLLVAGDRSSSGETFFARQLLALVPEQTHRRFHLPFRNCEFYADKALCRDVPRKLQFWIGPALVRIAWDAGWNRWKHLLYSKIEVEGAFVRGRKYKKRGDNWAAVVAADRETGLAGRLSVKLPTDFEQEIERARTIVLPIWSVLSCFGSDPVAHWEGGRDAERPERCPCGSETNTSARPRGNSVK